MSGHVEASVEEAAYFIHALYGPLRDRDSSVKSGQGRAFNCREWGLNDWSIFLLLRIGFRDYRVTTIYTSKYDHCILLLDASPVVGTDRGHGRGDYFRFDNCWSREADCIDRVRTTWEFTAGSTLSKLQAVGGALKHWAAILDVKREHNALLDKEESCWDQ
ncbi:hypothetical protein V6N13_093247 [Hibiscus sabdariffa]